MRKSERIFLYFGVIVFCYFGLSVTVGVIEGSVIPNLDNFNGTFTDEWCFTLDSNGDIKEVSCDVAYGD